VGKPWERGEKESSQAFAAFQLYLNQPHDARSFERVAEGLNKSRTLVARWSARDKWVERVRAFDSSVALEAADKLRAQRVKEHEEMRERHRVVGRLALAKATTALARSEKDAIPIESAGDVATLIKAGMMLEKSGHEDVAGPGRAKMSGDDRGSEADDLPRLTKLEVVIVGDGGKTLDVVDLVARLRSFYDTPGEIR